MKIGKRLFLYASALVLIIILGALIAVLNSHCKRAIESVELETENTSLKQELSPNLRIVELREVGFLPTTIEIDKEDVVIWKNLDFNNTHSIVSDAGTEIKSEKLAYGQNYSHTFNAEGTYDYHCSIRTYLKGRVIVK